MVRRAAIKSTICSLNQFAVSRAKSPWIAAKRAERSRRQRRKESLMLAGIVLLMIASMVAFGFYLKHFYFNTPRPPQNRPSPANLRNERAELGEPRR